MQHTLAFYTDAFVLVEQWKTTSLLGVLAAMFASCALGSLYECLSRYLFNWDNRPHRVCAGHRCQDLTLRSLRSTLHAVSVWVSYLLMLFLMTFNLWVMISILIGSACGYFFLGPKVDWRLVARLRRSKLVNSSPIGNSLQTGNTGPTKRAAPPDTEVETPMISTDIISEKTSVPDDRGDNPPVISKTSLEGGADSLTRRYCVGGDAEERVDLFVESDKHDIG